MHDEAEPVNHLNLKDAVDLDFDRWPVQERGYCCDQFSVTYRPRVRKLFSRMSLAIRTLLRIRDGRPILY
jgi:hypothetical protein